MKSNKLNLPDNLFLQALRIKEALENYKKQKLKAYQEYLLEDLKETQQKATPEVIARVGYDPIPSFKKYLQENLKDFKKDLEFIHLQDLLEAKLEPFFPKTEYLNRHYKIMYYGETISLPLYNVQPVRAYPLETSEMNFPVPLMSPNWEKIIEYLNDEADDLWEEKQDFNEWSLKRGLYCGLQGHMKQMDMLRPMDLVEMTINGKIKDYMIQVKRRSCEVEDSFARRTEELQKKYEMMLRKQDPTMRESDLEQDSKGLVMQDTQDAVWEQVCLLPESLTADTDEITINTVKQLYVIEDLEDQYEEGMDFLRRIPLFGRSPEAHLLWAEFMKKEFPDYENCLIPKAIQSHELETPDLTPYVASILEGHGLLWDMRRALTLYLTRTLSDPTEIELTSTMMNLPQIMTEICEFPLGFDALDRIPRFKE